jgi:hypothetical protein
MILALSKEALMNVRSDAFRHFALRGLERLKASLRNVRSNAFRHFALIGLERLKASLRTLRVSRGQKTPCDKLFPATLISALMTVSAFAQDARSGVANAPASASTFTFVRVEWQGERYGFSGRGSGPLWAHDYPTAEQNLYAAIGALTSLPLSYEYKILALKDEAIFDYPFLYICEVGYWSPGEEEVKILGEYLRRGGFLLVDDFRGGFEWRNFAAQMQRILPHEPQPLTLDHPVFHCFFEFERLGEHSPYWNMTPQYYGIFDAHGRLTAIINYNNDIGDGWEWPESDEVFSMEAFKLGINYLVYAMTH